MPPIDGSSYSSPTTTSARVDHVDSSMPLRHERIATKLLDRATAQAYAKSLGVPTKVIEAAPSRNSSSNGNPSDDDF